MLCLKEFEDYQLHKLAKQHAEGVSELEHQATQEIRIACRIAEKGIRIVVLQPGSGYFGGMSNSAYDQCPSFEWPTLRTWNRQERNLCTLGHKNGGGVINEIQGADVLICGSRGG